MALTREGIAVLTDEVGNISRNFSEIIERNEEFRTVLENSDFAEFAEGTDFGAEKQAELLDLVNIIDGDLNTAVTQLIEQTNAFIDDMIAINSAGY